MNTLHRSSVNGQTGLAALAEEARALCKLAADLRRQVAALERAPAPAHNGDLDLRTSRITPDELLDRWQADRGQKAEAHLLSRIFRRRAARRAAL
jgi:hypothetical protein